MEQFKQALPGPQCEEQELGVMTRNWDSNGRDVLYFNQGVSMKPRISMITLGVMDLEASIQFYKDGLGFPKMDSPPEVAFFTLNGSWLGLYGREALAADAEVPAEGSGFSGFALAHNVSSEVEVDQLLQQALSAGATLARPAQKTSWGGYSGYFKDPDGYLWEEAHNPFFWIGPIDEPAKQGD